MRDVDADSAGADDRHPRPGLGVAEKKIGVTDDVRKIAAVERDPARHDSRGEDQPREIAQRRNVAAALVQTHFYAEPRELVGVVTNRFVEVSFARNPACHAELSADLRFGFEEDDLVPESGKRAG